MHAKKFYLRSFGCQMNDYDTSRMADLLRERFGAEPVSTPEEADVVVLNTCSIREKAQEKVFSDLGRLREAKKSHPGQIIVCDADPGRLDFVRRHYPEVLPTPPEQVLDTVRSHSAHGGADAVLEVAGTPETFRMAWMCARPNAVVTVVALYDGPQVLPLPEMYGKNLTFKTGGVDGCKCAEILSRIAAGQLDTTPLITHTFPLADIEAAYDLFAHRRDGVMKVAIKP